MTGYFDTREQLISEVSRLNTDDTEFIKKLTGIEESVVADVNLVTGDREFPEGWREKIQNVIASRRLYIGDIPNEHVIWLAKASRQSPLIVELHHFFHLLAGEKVETRFGVLSDDPIGILRRRIVYDSSSP